MTFSLLQQPNFATSGLEIRNFDYLNDPDFQRLQQDVYASLTPARNAVNKLCRGLRWGILANDQIHWSNLEEYALSTDLNPDEKGAVRQMDLLPESWLQTPQVEQLARDVFRVFHPEGDSSRQAYVVQLSGIRYQPTVASTCYPSPDRPHQDGFNNGIVVLSRTPNLMGGQSRVYSVDGEALFEANLQPGQGLFVEDSRYKHQVLPMLQDTSNGGVGVACYRDILIIRVDPAKR